MFIFEILSFASLFFVFIAIGLSVVTLFGYSIEDAKNIRVVDIAILYIKPLYEFYNKSDEIKWGLNSLTIAFMLYTNILIFERIDANGIHSNVTLTNWFLLILNAGSFVSLMLFFITVSAFGFYIYKPIMEHGNELKLEYGNVYKLLAVLPYTLLAIEQYFVGSIRIMSVSFIVLLFILELLAFKYLIKSIFDGGMNISVDTPNKKIIYNMFAWIILITQVLFFEVYFASKFNINSFVTGNGDAVYKVFDLIYYTVISVTTIGFGDIIPKTSLAKIVTLNLSVASFVVFVIFVSYTIGNLKNNRNNVV